MNAPPVPHAAVKPRTVTVRADPFGMGNFYDFTITARVEGGQVVLAATAATVTRSVRMSLAEATKVSSVLTELLLEVRRLAPVR